MNWPSPAFDVMHEFPDHATRLIVAALCFKLNEFEKATTMLENGDLQMEITCIHLMIKKKSKITSGKLCVYPVEIESKPNK
ncbi:hypothetical protein Q1695_003518 [Nippostrongylus brasiliensis]|nr:hypothetical protein Q1695_003518 [Nippostrongylus brasiliensis]